MSDDSAPTILRATRNDEYLFTQSEQPGRHGLRLAGQALLAIACAAALLLVVALFGQFAHVPFAACLVPLVLLGLGVLALREAKGTSERRPLTEHAEALSLDAGGVHLPDGETLPWDGLRAEFRRSPRCVDPVTDTWVHFRSGVSTATLRTATLGTSPAALRSLLASASGGRCVPELPPASATPGADPDAAPAG